MKRSWIEIPTPKNLKEFYHYELSLARAFYAIEKRGVLTDAGRLEELRKFLLISLEDFAQDLSQKTSRFVAFSKKHAERLGYQRKDYINVSYPGDVKKLLEAKGFEIPFNRKTRSYSTGEDTLNALYAESGDEAILKILQIREYVKILGTYVNVKLHDGVLYSAYSVAGTVTGRRSSRKNIFGLGTNHQNLPKHSQLGKKFRQCVVARPGRILLSGDQSQAEDWPVNAIIAAFGGDTTGLDELRSGIDRHRRLASNLFGKPESACGKDTPERFMGKKTAHAGDYDMGPDEMARQMVKEGHTWVTIPLCADLLKGFHKTRPGVRGVFHEHVKETLSQTRTLRTPLGRERVFWGLRPYTDNKRTFKEAYSYIPQGTVGDNTGLAILGLESNQRGLAVLDGHDSIVLEVADDIRSVTMGVDALDLAFARTIRIGDVEFMIPVEYELGYNLASMQEFKRPQDAPVAYERLSVGSPVS